MVSQACASKERLQILQTCDPAKKRWLQRERGKQKKSSKHRRRHGNKAGKTASKRRTQQNKQKQRKGKPRRKQDKEKQHKHNSKTKATTRWEVKKLFLVMSSFRQSRFKLTVPTWNHTYGCKEERLNDESVKTKCSGRMEAILIASAQLPKLRRLHGKSCLTT